MAKHVLLNNVQHKDTKVITRYGEEFADNVASVVAFPMEFVELQKEYPIFFRLEDGTERFQSIALLGLQKDENLFLDDSLPSGWKADYIPAMIERGPFLIGFQQQDVTSEPTAVVHIDMEHPKVNETEGQNVFLEHGGNSPYLNRISTCLQSIHQGMNMQGEMFKSFISLDLLEPVDVEYELASGEKCRLTGNYTVNEEKLRALSAEQLFELNQAGFLQFAFAAIASVTNVRKLINLKNKKIR